MTSGQVRVRGEILAIAPSGCFAALTCFASVWFCGAPYSWFQPQAGRDPLSPPPRPRTRRYRAVGSLRSTLPPHQGPVSAGWVWFGPPGLIHCQQSGQKNPAGLQLASLFSPPSFNHSSATPSLVLTVSAPPPPPPTPQQYHQCHVHPGPVWLCSVAAPYMAGLEQQLQPSSLQPLSLHAKPKGPGPDRGPGPNQGPGSVQTNWGIF